MPLLILFYPIKLLQTPEHIKLLILGCKKNDRKAQSALYAHYFQMLMSVVRKYKKNNEDAAVLVNESFFKIFTQIEKYKDELPFEYWIKRITINVVIDEYRKNNRQRELEVYNDLDTDFKEVTIGNEVLNFAEKKLQANDILKLLEQLDDEERMVFNLFEIEGYKHKEIALMMLISERTSKRYLQQAKTILKEKLIRLFSPKTLIL